jgi:hypothetical protein
MTVILENKGGEYVGHARTGKSLPEGWCVLDDEVFCPDHYDQAHKVMEERWKQSW